MQEVYTQEMRQTMGRLALTFGKLHEATINISQANEADDLDGLEQAVSLQSALLTRVEKLRAVLLVEAQAAVRAATANSPEKVTALTQALKDRRSEIIKAIDKDFVATLGMLFELGATVPPLLGGTGSNPRNIALPEGFDRYVLEAREIGSNSPTARLEAELRELRQNTGGGFAVGQRLSNAAFRDIRVAAAEEYGFDFEADYLEPRDKAMTGVY